MFRCKRVSVQLGDVFAEKLTGNEDILRPIGLAPLSMDGSVDRTFQSFWLVTELCRFNNLPHARLVNQESDQQRMISTDALAQQNIYRKQ